MAIKKLSSPIKPKRILIVATIFVVALSLVLFLSARRYFFSSILNIPEGQTEYLYIPTGSDFNDVVTLLSADDRLADEEAFCVMSTFMGYRDNVKAGRYKLTRGLTARSLVSLLRSGSQYPVRVTFNNVRSLEQLAGVVSKSIEADSSALLAVMTDSAVLRSMGLDETSASVIYLPDTYEIWWNITPEGWVERMADEYERFWTSSRKSKADSIGLSQFQVATLASIVEEESNRSDDRRVIAGLYLNRLRIGMPLQACPTVKYALGDFSLRRITTADTRIESPYNTYVNLGLPPGPIRITSKSVIDDVLNPTASDYLYMCARPDGSGRHDFSRTLAGHQRNAANYHKMLNQNKIYR